MIEPTDRLARGLRRFNFERPDTALCPVNRYHNARAWIDEVLTAGFVTSEGYLGVGPGVDHADPRWPAKCEYCDYHFGPGDEWQVWMDWIYRSPSGDVFKLCDAPPGSMWYADWSSHKGPDGRCLMMKLPGGFDWMIDGPSGNGNHSPWTRTGAPPMVTANPSILVTGHYHGWLRDGYLIEC
jgi:hypothetical protein